MKRIEVTDSAHKLIMREKKRLKGVKIPDVVEQLIKDGLEKRRK